MDCSAKESSTRCRQDLKPHLFWTHSHSLTLDEDGQRAVRLNLTSQNSAHKRAEAVFMERDPIRRLRLSVPNDGGFRASVHMHGNDTGDQSAHDSSNGGTEKRGMRYTMATDAFVPERMRIIVTLKCAEGVEKE